ncbi:glycosyltransferase [Patescibacteria group bacterium]|nr:MAG: glycosyltransferase [Patescibacteria group bacterium]
MSVRVAAIIPAYDEETTVADVVRAVRTSPLVSETIVVSDASTDRTAAVAREAGARVVERPTNGGKGAAVLSGLAMTDAPLVLLLDADLVGLTADHVERLLAPVLDGSRVMNCSQRDRGWFTPFTRWLPLVSGERALPREIIERVPPHLLRGFQLEEALNYYCRRNRLPYGSVPLPGLTMRRKFQKVGWRKALVQYVRMWTVVAKAMILVRIAALKGEF